jgi:hypothetical protein
VKASDLAMGFQCSEDWNAMPGDARTRHCARCDRQVVNLSARTEAGATLALAAAPRPCVRFATTADGHVRFRPSRLPRLVAAVAALASVPARADPGTITVRVVDPYELPVPRTTLTLVDVAGAPVQTALTDDVGEARFTDLPELLWTVDVTRDDFKSVRATGVAVGTSISLVLEPFAATDVTGRLPARPRFARLPAAWRAARVEIAQVSDQWNRVAIRCADYASALRARFVGRHAAVQGVPIGADCRARLTGTARALVIEFPVVEEEVHLDAADSRSTRARR